MTPLTLRSRSSTLVDVKIGQRPVTGIACLSGCVPTLLTRTLAWMCSRPVTTSTGTRGVPTSIGLRGFKRSNSRDRKHPPVVRMSFEQRKLEYALESVDEKANGIDQRDETPVILSAVFEVDIYLKSDK